MDLWILFGSFTLLMLIGTPIAFCLGVSAFVTALYMKVPPLAIFAASSSGRSGEAIARSSMSSPTRRDSIGCTPATTADRSMIFGCSTCLRLNASSWWVSVPARRAASSSA